MTPGNWKSWGESVIGPLHLRDRLPNQDAWLSAHRSWGDVIAVSDGLGSHPHSDVGARAACRAVLGAADLFRRFPESRIEDFLGLVHAHWLMRISPFSPRECSATCLFAIRVGGRCLLAQLGDGLVVACGEEVEETVILADDKIHSFSNVTESLGRDFRPEQWRYRMVSEGACDAVILCTDGISDDIPPERQADFARDLFLSYRETAPRQRQKELRSWMTKWPVPCHSDDKTIACLFRKEKSRS